MTRGDAILLTICLAVSSAPLPAQEARVAELEPVSPGAAGLSLAEGNACPTFSWAARLPVERFRLQVAQVAIEAQASPEAGGEEPLDVVLDVSIPGGARSWTPPAVRCLERGRSYVWFVQTERAGETIEVSPGFFFTVADVPSAAEVDWAYGVLSRHLERPAEAPKGSDSVVTSAAPQRSTHLPTGGASEPARATGASGTSEVDLVIDGAIEVRGIRAVAAGAAEGNIEAQGDISFQKSAVESTGQIITATTTTGGLRDDLVRLSAPELGTVLVTAPGGTARAGELQVKHLHARSVVRSDGGIGLSGSSWTGDDGGTGVSYVPTFVDLINCSVIGRRCVPMDEAEALCPAGGLVIGVRFWETDTDQVGIQVWCTHP